MVSATILFLVGFVFTFAAQNALRGPRRTLPWYLQPMWLPAMLTSELLPVRWVISVATIAATVPLGALDHLVGRVGLALHFTAWLGYLVLGLRTRRTRHALPHQGDLKPIPVDLRTRITRNPYRLPESIERIADVPYNDGCALDLYRSPRSDGSKVILQVHGGGWTGGNRRQQARPLLHHLASAGWTAVSVSYPLDRSLGIEERLTAIKRAITWIRHDASDYGIDGGTVVITGGSAGGHLASLASLTARHRSFQRGFEHLDASVDACISFYGVYDFANRNNTRDPWAVIPRTLMRATPAEAPDAYRQASPLDQVHAGAPPFLVIHGSHDTLVPAAEARQFVEALASVSDARVDYAELPGATHAFDIIPSPRTRTVVAAIEHWLDALPGAPSGS